MKLLYSLIVFWGVLICLERLRSHHGDPDAMERHIRKQLLGIQRATYDLEKSTRRNHG